MTHLSTQEIATLRQEALAADHNGRLTPAQVDIIRRHDWCRMLAPRHCGGGEMPLPDAVRLQETIAAIDGSLGWLVTLCAGAGWFGGFLPPDIAQEILGSPDVCLAGSGAPSGTADKTDGGYLVNGSWHYATGAQIATYFTFNAVIRESGMALANADGTPVIKSFVVPASAVAVTPDWKGMGMKASSTDSFTLGDYPVAAGYAFTIDHRNTTTPGPLYRFPFMSLALATFAANISGMARHFLAQADELLASRNHPVKNCPLREIPEIAERLTAAHGNLLAAMDCVYRQLEQDWQRVCQGEQDAIDQLHFGGLAMTTIDTARRAVNDIYPLCGLRASDPESEINLVWRDFNTATQHSLLIP